MMNLVHVWYHDRYGLKFYVVQSPTPYMTLRSRSQTLYFCIAIFYNFTFFAKPSMDFIHLWCDDRALSNILQCQFLQSL